MSIWKLVFLLAVSFSLVSGGTDGKCRGLVFSGGGDRGSYEVGVLQAFTELLNPSDIAYDIIAGTSAGSINVVGFGLQKQGNEKEAAQQLRGFWDTITQSDVYKDWSLGIAEGLFYEYGLYDTSPLKSYLTNILSQNGGMKRPFSMVTTNANLAIPERLNQTMTLDQTVTGTMASSAFPVFLPHIQYGSYPYMDGGLFINVDIGGAILRCRESGYADQNIIIDTLFCDNGTLNSVDASGFKTADMASRAITMYAYALEERDYVYAREDYPNVNFRYTVMPSQYLPSGFVPLEFNHTNIETCINIGLNDAKNVIKAGEGVIADQIYERLKSKYSAEFNEYHFYSALDEELEQVEVMAL